ncbi:rRNA biogenesis protein rrp5 [Trapelia coarctata]|nr:rRNA biogenesis protein rrp5 [Trapelia coarctata]
MPALKRKSETVSDPAIKKPKSSHPQKSTVSVLRGEEPAFPRGGASVLTPLEHKQIQIQAKQDVLFEQSTGKTARAFESEDDENEGDEMGERDRASTTVRQKRRSQAVNSKKQKTSKVIEEPKLKIEGLSYKRLVPGSMVLGQVMQINRYDIALSLPNNLTGYIPLTAISDKVTSDMEALAAEDISINDAEESKELGDIDLKNYVSVGQYLRAHVTSTSAPSGSEGKMKKHIELSINPKQANTGLSKSDMITNNVVQAVVTSVEDHGLVMSLGLDDSAVRGFMGSREIGHSRKIANLREGAVFLCIVIGQSSNGNIIKLSADIQRIGTIKKSNFLADAPTVDSFLPGSAVELLVADISSTGLAGKVMGLLDVTADLIHSGAAASGKDLEKKYSVGMKVKGRVICTFPIAEEKKLGISFLDHVIGLSSQLSKGTDEHSVPTDTLPISSIIEQARVAKVEPGLGLFMDIGVKGIRGFAHISQLSDSKVETLYQSTGPYKTGSVHRARVIGYNPMDGIFIVSLEKRILDLPFLRLEDVQVGQIVKGTVQKLIVNPAGVGGVLVNITEGISGLVPEMHLSDIHLQHPEKKFREGLNVTARVLSIDLGRRLMRFTLKKALINSDAAVWKSYEDLAQGMQAPGTLVNVLLTGAVVQFYGPVRGFLPVSQMSESYIKDPKQHFHVGQVVNVHILSVDATEKRMLVSCRDPAAFDAGQEKALKGLGPGAIVSGTVSEKTADEIIVELTGSGLKASLRFEHLTDGSAQKSLGAAKKIRVGQALQDLLVLSKSENKRLVKLTSKPSLVKASRANRLPQALDELKIGAEVSGYIRNIIPTGAFLQFAGDLTGFLPAKLMPEEIKKLPEFGMRRDQSVVVKVLSINHGQERFTLTQQALPAQGKPDLAASQVPDRALTYPADGVSTSIDDYTFGKLTKAKIISVKETQMNVQLADGVQGRIDVSQIFDSWEDIKDRKHPFKSFSPRQVLPVRILGVHDSRNHRFLPITHSNKAPVFELSAKPMDQTEADFDILSIDKVAEGSAWTAFVNNVTADCIWVNLSPNVRGRIRAMDVSDDLSLLADLEKNFPVGSALRARVTHVDPANNRLDLSARSGSASTAITIKDLTKGMVLPGRVTKTTERSVMVQLSENVSAPVHLIDLADDYDLANPTIYQKNQTIRVCVGDLDIPNKKIILSTRPSKVLSSSLPIRDQEITSISQLKVNDVVRGFIKNVADNGVFVSLASNITGFIRITDLSDSYIKDWKAGFEIDQLVQGKITAVDPTLHHIQLSLKRSVLDKDYVAPLTYADMHMGRVVTGKIRKVEDFGVFIVVDNSSNVSGLCHRSEMAEERVHNVKKLYDEGDAVKAIVLKVELEKRRISFGLKASYFSKEADENDSDEDDSDGMDGVQLMAGAGDKIADESPEHEDLNLDDVEDMESEADTVFSANSDTEAKVLGGLLPAHNGVSLTAGGFDWTGGLKDAEVQDTHSDTDREVPTKKKKKRRKAEIKVDKTSELDAHGPRSVADFERLLLGQPNSSYLWLSYMAFQLQLSEVTKAREIAERAIRTIAHSKDTDTEVLNVWVAYLNLENTYGSDETLEEVFKRACERNDAEEMHNRLTSIYIQSGKNERADTLLQTMVKRYSQDPKVWLNYAAFLFDTLAAPHRARDLLPRAMQSLPRHHHLDLTSKFAQLEFRSSNGDPERGRTIFEGLLSTFPKRLDLWNVMLDLEIKLGNKEQIRRLFGRVTGSKLKAKKAKYFFKKWLDWEEKEGDEKSSENVKARAAEFVRKQVETIEHGA